MLRWRGPLATAKQSIALLTNIRALSLLSWSLLSNNWWRRTGNLLVIKAALLIIICIYILSTSCISMITLKQNIYGFFVFNGGTHLHTALMLGYITKFIWHTHRKKLVGTLNTILMIQIRLSFLNHKIQHSCLMFTSDNLYRVCFVINYLNYL